MKIAPLFLSGKAIFGGILNSNPWRTLVDNGEQPWTLAGVGGRWRTLVDMSGAIS
jgi:hypothetical protein